MEKEARSFLQAPKDAYFSWHSSMHKEKDTSVVFQGCIAIQIFNKIVNCNNTPFQSEDK